MPSCRETDFEGPGTAPCDPEHTPPPEPDDDPFPFPPGPRPVPPDEGDPETPPGPGGPMECEPEDPVDPAFPDDPEGPPSTPRIFVPKPPPNKVRVLRLHPYQLNNFPGSQRGRGGSLVGGIALGGGNFTYEEIEYENESLPEVPSTVGAVQEPVTNSSGDIIGWNVYYTGLESDPVTLAPAQDITWRLEDYDQNSGALIDAWEKECRFIPVQWPRVSVGSFCTITHGTSTESGDAEGGSDFIARRVSADPGNPGGTADWEWHVRASTCRNFDPQSSTGFSDPPYDCSFNWQRFEPVSNLSVILGAGTGFGFGGTCSPNRCSSDTDKIIWIKTRWSWLTGPGGVRLNGDWSPPIGPFGNVGFEPEPLFSEDPNYCL